MNYLNILMLRVMICSKYLLIKSANHMAKPVHQGVNSKMEQLSLGISQQITTNLGLAFVQEREGASGVCFANQHEDLQDAYKQSFTPIDVLDNIYAVLYSPSYQERYKEFLKIDFPRVSCPPKSGTKNK